MSRSGGFRGDDNNRQTNQLLYPVHAQGNYELARDNNIHLLCLPSHTTHILQLLNVSVVKLNFSKAGTKYLAANHKWQVIVAEAWPHSLTALNVMSGFKKCGIFPHAGDVTVNSNSPLFSPEKEALYRKRYMYEEGYDVDDPGYTAWLKINHPTEVSIICTGSSSSLQGSSNVPKPRVVMCWPRFSFHCNHL